MGSLPQVTEEQLDAALAAWAAHDLPGAGATDRGCMAAALSAVGLSGPELAGMTETAVRAYRGYVGVPAHRREGLRIGLNAALAAPRPRAAPDPARQLALVRELASNYHQNLLSAQSAMDAIVAALL